MNTPEKKSAGEDDVQHESPNRGIGRQVGAVGGLVLDKLLAKWERIARAPGNQRCCHAECAEDLRAALRAPLVARAGLEPRKLIAARGMVLAAARCRANTIASVGDEDAATIIREAEGWRPIESAPVQQEAVLLLTKQLGHIVVGWRRAGTWTTAWADEPIPACSHWMPLPIPPVDEAGK